MYPDGQISVLKVIRSGDRIFGSGAGLKQPLRINSRCAFTIVAKCTEHSEPLPSFVYGRVARLAAD